MTKRRFPFAVLLTLTLVLGVVIGWVGSGAAAGEPLPGSEQDPLVSRSYVDSRIEEILATSGSGFQMIVVEVPSGHILVGGAGTEIIVRAGNASVIDSELGGLCDVTQGRDLRYGEEAPRNHLLLVPRDDGRGILAVTGVTVMVRGNYSIQ
ncbi:MAG: hypothetical protein ACOX5M_10335 [Bacillota bacterium]|jgi:hypothetical protein